MTLNDKPSHAVSRLSTAGSEFSPVSIKYFFMGPGPVDDFDVDGCGSSSAFFSGHYSYGAILGARGAL